MALLEIRGLTKRFGTIEVLRGIDIDVEQGAFVCLLGPSGCGKSTLLRCIAGLESTNSGEITIAGRSMAGVPPSRRDLAMVFQSYALYPHLNVRKNMAFGLSLQGMVRSEIDRRVGEAARMLAIDALLDRKPRQLSGGQRQRVAIGRAIVRDPRIFLFDEPLSNLDAALRTQTRYELARLHKELGRTMLFVTHDQVEAMTLSTTVVVLNGGRVEQAGPPLDLYNRPANRFVAGFIGSPQMNFLPARARPARANGLELVLGGERLTLSVQAQADGTAARLAELGIRPEHVTIAAPSAPGLAATVKSVERLGVETIVFTQTQTGQNVLARAPGSLPLRDGEAVKLAFDPAETHFFDSDGLRIETAWQA